MALGRFARVVFGASLRGRLLRSRVVGCAAIAALVVSGLNTHPAAAANANLHLDKTVDSALLTPSLGLTLRSDRASAIPGNTSAVVSAYWDAVTTTVAFVFCAVSSPLSVRIAPVFVTTAV